MTKSHIFPVIAAVPVSVLVACGDNDKDGGVPTPDGTPSRTASSRAPTASVTASPKPTAAPTRVVGRYQDLTLVLLRPATMDLKAASAVEALQQFDQLFAEMVAGAPTPAKFSQLANPATAKILNDLLEPQRQAKERGAGQLTIRTTKVKVGTSLVMVDGCFDQSELMTVRADGSRYVDPTVKRGPTMALRAMLTKTAGPWRVDEYVLSASKC
ncbi:hypothetical protein [Kribbella sp. NPDC006257]|uniref:hypothetical protein n=1 Tax=Kribbella sp. NPDC006257 TaxID=3156738 RepID=UPI0033A7008E